MASQRTLHIGDATLSIPLTASHEEAIEAAAILYPDYANASVKEEANGDWTLERNAGNKG
jgi:hypothetical protein